MKNAKKPSACIATTEEAKSRKKNVTSGKKLRFSSIEIVLYLKDPSFYKAGGRASGDKVLLEGRELK